MANDGVKPAKATEVVAEAPEKPVKKVRKKRISQKEQRVLTAINRLSKPTPNFEYMQNYYLPKPTARNLIKPSAVPDQKKYRLEEGVPERIIVNR